MGALHQHDWTWGYLGVDETASVRTGHKEYVGLRTCPCGAFERVSPNLGETPDTAARRLEREADDDRQRERRREYNQRAKDRHDPLLRAARTPALSRAT